jgi:hypothetical protein
MHVKVWIMLIHEPVGIFLGIKGAYEYRLGEVIGSNDIRHSGLLLMHGAPLVRYVARLLDGPLGDGYERLNPSIVDFGQFSDASHVCRTFVPRKRLAIICVEKIPHSRALLLHSDLERPWRKLDVHVNAVVNPLDLDDPIAIPANLGGDDRPSGDIEQEDWVIHRSLPFGMHIVEDGPSRRAHVFSKEKGPSQSTEALTSPEGDIRLDQRVGATRRKPVRPS